MHLESNQLKILKFIITRTLMLLESYQLKPLRSNMRKMWLHLEGKSKSSTSKHYAMNIDELMQKNQNTDKTILLQ